MPDRPRPADGLVNGFTPAVLTQYTNEARIAIDQITYASPAPPAASIVDVLRALLGVAEAVRDQCWCPLHGLVGHAHRCNYFDDMPGDIPPDGPLPMVKLPAYENGGSRMETPFTAEELTLTATDDLTKADAQRLAALSAAVAIIQALYATPDGAHSFDLAPDHQGRPSVRSAVLGLAEGFYGFLSGATPPSCDSNVALPSNAGPAV